ncbi:hypothetical protein AMJ85_03790, partial [candidate division BRC1 bacterium SM23_51]
MSRLPHEVAAVQQLSFIIHRLVAVVVGLSFSSLCPAVTTTTARFPVEAVAYHAIAASFLENPRLVERYADMLTSHDLVLQAEGGMPSGCADNLAWLWAESLAAPAARVAGYRTILAGRRRGL